MVKILFNKLVRDKLRKVYQQAGQKVVYRKLSKTEYAEALKRKIIEETNEIPTTGSPDEIASELADVQQVIDDLAVASDVSKSQIEVIRQRKFDEKGGFGGATFVETLELRDDDTKWIEYYRKRADRHPEIK